jgi:hypothetical protein
VSITTIVFPSTLSEVVIKASRIRFLAPELFVEISCIEMAVFVLYTFLWTHVCTGRTDAAAGLLDAGDSAGELLLLLLPA